MSNIQLSNLYTSKKFTTFLECIEGVSDPRVERNKLHRLDSMLVIIIFALLGGANNPSAIACFGVRHYDWFKLIININNGIPSHDTFSRILAFIDPDELSFWLTLWTDEDLEKGDTKHIAIDGKEDNANQFYCMRAFDVKNEQVIAYARVPEENNEITVAPLLLKKIDLKNTVVTGDAINTQTKIVRYIASQGANYILALKKNQHQFYADVKLYLDDIENNPALTGTFNKHESIEKSRGRVTKRICISTDRTDWLWQKKQWRNLVSITVIKTITTFKGKIKSTLRYFISDLKSDAYAIGRYIRDHLAIENKCHRGLDINFESDQSTIQDYTASLNLSILKDFALYLLYKHDSKMSINEKRISNGYQFVILLKTLLNPGF